MTNQQFKDLLTYLRGLFQFTILFILIMTLLGLATIFISLNSIVAIIFLVAGMGIMIPAYLYAKPIFKIEDKWLTNNSQD